MSKLDYRKNYKELYLPKAEPVVVEVPPMTFIMIDGKGAPDGREYQNAIPLLYSLSYTIKMKGKELPGYLDYAVFPLEGLWWGESKTLDLGDRNSWNWTSLIRQPDFVTTEVFEWATALAQKKKPESDFSKARLERFEEGLCVQMMHLGLYSDEPVTIEHLHSFIEQNNLVADAGLTRKHHEIYLSDPNRCAPEKMKTVIRLPVVRK